MNSISSAGLAESGQSRESAGRTNESDRTQGPEERMKAATAQITEEALFERTTRRRRVELLAERVAMLEGKDKAMMEMCLQGHASCRQIARLLGRSQSSVARRVKTLLRRLTDETYAILALYKDEFTRRELRIARDYFLLGVPMSQIARQTDLTYYYVRTTVKSIRRKIKRARRSAAGSDVLSPEGGSST